MLTPGKGYKQRPRKDFLISPALFATRSHTTIKAGKGVKVAKKVEYTLPCSCQSHAYEQNMNEVLSEFLLRHFVVRLLQREQLRLPGLQKTIYRGNWRPSPNFVIYSATKTSVLRLFCVANTTRINMDTKRELIGTSLNCVGECDKHRARGLKWA